MTEHLDFGVLAIRALEKLSPADRHLVDWHFAKPRPGFSRGAWDLAVGYLLERALGREVSAKLARECQVTLDEMRVERMRELERRAA